MDNIQLNLNNLTDDERKQLMTLVEKGNKVDKVFKPKKGDKYWYICANGDVNFNIWKDDGFNNHCYMLGNCYPTEESAEFAKQKKIVTTELERFAKEHNEYELDWENESQCKYSLVYDCSNHMVDFSISHCYLDNEVYFSSLEVLQQAIDTIGKDRLKKYYFGVEE